MAGARTGEENGSEQRQSGASPSEAEAGVGLGHVPVL